MDQNYEAGDPGGEDGTLQGGPKMFEGGVLGPQTHLDTSYAGRS